MISQSSLGGLILCAFLSGCAATKSELQYLDSPVPDLARIPSCKLQGGQLHRLENGMQCMALVRASDWVTRIPVAVSAGERYVFTMAPNQFWYDKDERIHAPGGAAGDGVKKLVNSWKRNPDSDWFALMASTVTQGDEDAQELETHDVGKTGYAIFQKSGQLALYPNDAYGPVMFPKLFYGNNRGQVWVRVERRAAAQ
jgi:hypothetical protein